jgi:hypothetical protein
MIYPKAKNVSKNNLRFIFSGMKKFLGSMAKKTTDAAKSLAAEASKKKAGAVKYRRPSLFSVFLSAIFHICD